MSHTRNTIRWAGIGVRFLSFSKAEGGGDENEECASELHREGWSVLYRSKAAS